MDYKKKAGTKNFHFFTLGTGTFLVMMDDLRCKKEDGRGMMADYYVESFVY